MTASSISSTGEAFSASGLERTLQSTPRASRVAGLRQALTAHLGRQPAGDDVSVLIIDCAMDDGGSVAKPGEGGKP